MPEATNQVISLFLLIADVNTTRFYSTLKSWLNKTLHSDHKISNNVSKNDTTIWKIQYLFSLSIGGAR